MVPRKALTLACYAGKRSQQVDRSKPILLSKNDYGFRRPFEPSYASSMR